MLARNLSRLQTVTDTMIYTTGIGSVPFDSFESAVAHVVANYSLPFLPEIADLRSRQPRMMSHLLSGESLAAYERGSWKEFRSTLCGEGETFSHVYDVDYWQKATMGALRKVQMIGPYTLRTLWQAHFCDISHAEAQALVGRFLLGKIRQLSAQLDGTPTLLFFDEPVLTPENVSAAGITLKAILGATSKGTTLQFGVHCCAKLPLHSLVQAYADFGLAIDYHLLVDTPTAREELQRHLQTTPHWTILGIADTAATDFSHDLTAKAAKAAKDIMRRPSDSMRLQKVAFSGACGTGTRSAAFEEALAASLRFISNP